MPTLFKDYYAILELDIDADAHQVKQSYRRLVRTYHPDKHSGQQELYTQKLQELNEAYRILSDNEARMDYDWKYRQRVLGVGPQYEIVEDTTPPDTTLYRHRFTKIKKRTLMVIGWLLLALILYRYLR